MSATASDVASIEDSDKRASMDAQQHLDTLKHHGLRFGFEAQVRRRVYQLLLDAQAPPEVENDHESAHADEQQVLLDTNRSFNHCLPRKFTDAEVAELRNELQLLICCVLRRHPWLHYYQGYHDIAQLVLLIADRDQAVALVILEQLSKYALRDFMLSTLAPSMSMLPLAHDIIRVYDPDYYRILSDVEPYYAVSPLLTWFMHNLENYQDACRVLDLLVASADPSMVLYLIAAQTIFRKQQVADADGDPDLIFHVLSKPRHEGDASLESWLQLAVKLYESIRPRQLRHWSRISKHSALRTPLDLTDDQAKEHASLQEAEVAEAERRRRAKASGGISALWVRLLDDNAGRIGVAAVTVGVLAAGLTYYLKTV
jgi:hypothetical protein